MCLDLRKKFFEWDLWDDSCYYTKNDKNFYCFCYWFCNNNIVKTLYASSVAGCHKIFVDCSIYAQILPKMCYNFLNLIVIITNLLHLVIKCVTQSNNIKSKILIVFETVRAETCASKCHCWAHPNRTAIPWMNVVWLAHPVVWIMQLATKYKHTKYWYRLQNILTKRNQ